jgi:beta-lactamase regulating signal transducer with metallopeptidase domain
MVLVSSLLVSYILPFCIITIHKPAPVVDNHAATPVQTPVQTLVPATIDAVDDSYPAQVQTSTQMQSTTLTAPTRKHIDWMLTAIIIYAIGTISLIILRLVAMRKVWAVIRRGRVAKQSAGYKIVISKDNIRPFSWMHYIVLPEEYADLSRAQAVIRHEYSHISHHHSVELLATDILSAFQWFNPAVWLLRHDLCCVQEFQADAAVLESGHDKVEYEMSLLSIATAGLYIPLVNGLGESSLRSRILMMNRKHSRRFNMIKLIYLPIVIAVALVLMSNTIYDVSVNTSTITESNNPDLEEPAPEDVPVIAISDLPEIEAAPNSEPAETVEDGYVETVEPEFSQFISTHIDGSLLESSVVLPSYQDQRVVPQSLPDVKLDNLLKQYPELNSLESIYDDGIITNDKPYKGYISCIQLSKGVYSFWVMGLKDKTGKVVSIELGSIDNAIDFLNNLITSYKHGVTIDFGGYTFTGERSNTFSIPRTDGINQGPYLITVKNLKHDLSVLENRKQWGTAFYDDIAFFTMENKPDHYELIYPDPGYPFMYENIYMDEDCGITSATTQIEIKIRNVASLGKDPRSTLADTRFNGVIIFPPLQKELLRDGRIEYYQMYIPIIYDPEQYQAPLTEYQRGLKRSVFRKHSKKDKNK